MTMPRIKAHLIRTMGEQMRDATYMAKVEKELWQENPELATVCNAAMDVLNLIEEYDGMDSKSFSEAAQTVGRTTYLMVYQSIKQQMICDELSE